MALHPQAVQQMYERSVFGAATAAMDRLFGSSPDVCAAFRQAADFLVGCQLRAFEKTCADKVAMPVALAAYTERLFALPAVAKFKAGEKKAA